MGCMRASQLEARLLGSCEPGCWRVGRAEGTLGCLGSGCVRGAVQASARPQTVFCSPLPLAPAGEDIEKRTALEKRFQELCDREAALMAEIATLRKEAEA